MMKFLIVLFVLVVQSQQDEPAYAYQTIPDTSYYNHDWTSNDLESQHVPSFNQEKQDLTNLFADMDVILPIAVFGGLGLGALAYIDTLNRQNNLCNKLRDITNVARTNAASGTTLAALVPEQTPGG